MEENDRRRISDLLNELATAIGVSTPVQAGQPNAVNRASAPSRAPAVENPVVNSTRRHVQNDSPAPDRRAGPSNVLAELRNRFSPYPPQSHTRFAGRGARQNRQVTQNYMWSHQFYCLDTPERSVTPDRRLANFLKEEQLGDVVVTMDLTSDSSQVEIKIREAFPLLRDVDFELCKAIQGGHNRPLVRISATDAVPSVLFLKQSRVGMIYVKPKQAILDDTTNVRENTVSAHDGTTADSPIELASSTDVLTLSEFRSKLYEEDPRPQNIFLRRDCYLRRVLAIYKNPNFNFYREPKVEFSGESGDDIGALSKEYFWRGLLALGQETYDGKPLFEGEMNHLVPTTDETLHFSIFTQVGKFIAHALIHCGIGFVGLSPTVVSYLNTTDIDSDTPMPITSKDVPDILKREAIIKVIQLQSGATQTTEEKEIIRQAAQEAGVFEPVSKDNSAAVIEYILYHEVVEKRKLQLDALKKGFSQDKLIKFLSNKEYLIQAAFPRQEDISYPNSIVLGKINTNVEGTGCLFIKSYIASLDSERMKKLLCAWTGWPLLPEGDLHLNFETDITFLAHACYNTIDVPMSFSNDDLKIYFDRLIDFSSAGFGEM